MAVYRNDRPEFPGGNPVAFSTVRCDVEGCPCSVETSCSQLGSFVAERIRPHVARNWWWAYADGKDLCPKHRTEALRALAPTTDVVRTWVSDGDLSRADREKFRAAFDRWLAGERARIWDEAAQRVRDGYRISGPNDNPYRKENN